ncbi:MAG: thioredoxin-dependent thiol peroxidase [Rickettsiales bacterium]|nr:thioredoxin-dependent thiol peroxidase [Rickettsiales bacterium]
MSSAAQEIADNQPQIGDSAPAINLPNDQGKTISLSDLKGKNVVVYFYPKDDTPGCTTEGKDFRDLYAKFQDANTEIFGISKCPVAKHDKFKCKYEFPFALLSDEEGDVCERYGVWVEKNMYGKKYMGIQRTTFLINAEGKIAATWPKVKVANHVQEVLEAASAL